MPSDRLSTSSTRSVADAPVALVTGAAGALGQAVAAQLAQQGHRLVLLDRGEAGLAPLAQRLSPTPVWAHAVDLTDAAATHAAVQAAVAQAGRLDAVVNVAGGFAMGQGVSDMALADLQPLLATNVGSLLHVVSAAVPALRQQGGGAVVNVAAASAQRGLAHMGAYAVSKSAVLRLTESLSAELKHQGIRVNAVLPSIIDTPANRAAMGDDQAHLWVSPQALAEVIGFLCSPAARAIHGVGLPVTGLL